MKIGFSGERTLSITSPSCEFFALLHERAEDISLQISYGRRFTRRVSQHWISKVLIRSSRPYLLPFFQLLCPFIYARLYSGSGIKRFVSSIDSTYYSDIRREIHPLNGQQWNVDRRFDKR